MRLKVGTNEKYRGSGRFLAPIVVIDVFFIFLFGRHLGIILFPLLLTPADLIGNV
jgi:hypothetical protein